MERLKELLQSGETFTVTVTLIGGHQLEECAVVSVEPTCLQLVGCRIIPWSSVLYVTYNLD